MKAIYRINWGNGQVQSIKSKAEGLKMIKEDIYGAFAKLQVRHGADDWQAMSGHLHSGFFDSLGTFETDAIEAGLCP